MPLKEAKARIKINKLLETAGWLFFDANGHRANILLENNVKIKESIVDEFGNDFEIVTRMSVSSHWFAFIRI
jgi:type I restriction enzyme, R subunit